MKITRISENEKQFTDNSPMNELDQPFPTKVVEEDEEINNAPLLYNSFKVSPLKVNRVQASRIVDGEIIDYKDFKPQAKLIMGVLYNPNIVPVASGSMFQILGVESKECQAKVPLLLSFDVLEKSKPIAIQSVEFAVQTEPNFLEEISRTYFGTYFGSKSIICAADIVSDMFHIAFKSSFNFAIYELEKSYVNHFGRYPSAIMLISRNTDPPFFFLDTISMIKGGTSYERSYGFDGFIVALDEEGEELITQYLLKDSICKTRAFATSESIKDFATPIEKNMFHEDYNSVESIYKIMDSKLNIEILKEKKEKLNDIFNPSKVIIAGKNETLFSD